MTAPIPSPSALRALRRAAHPQLQPQFHPRTQGQVRHATLIRRPKRPYTFTQLVTLSDGSSFLQRTTSPQPVYKSTKDQRNTPLWNPSSQKLLNVEEDEAGKLRAFRAKFGRGWDAERTDEQNAEARDGQPKGQSGDMLMDLISGYGKKPEDKIQANSTKGSPATSAKGNAGKK